MSSLTIFPPKIDSADLFLDFDFLSQLDVGETISGATVTATLFSGVDATPSAIISGADTVSGPVVTQKIVDGVVGVIYLLSCAITTSLGATKIMQGYLAVIDTNPYEA
jgi:hypothetical protein